MQCGYSRTVGSAARSPSRCDRRPWNPARATRPRTPGSPRAPIRARITVPGGALGAKLAVSPSRKPIHERRSTRPHVRSGTAVNADRSGFPLQTGVRQARRLQGPMRPSWARGSRQLSLWTGSAVRASSWASSRVTSAAVALAVTSSAVSAPTIAEATAGRESSHASDT